MKRACRSSPISKAICHFYVHAKADLDMAKTLLVNAKMRRTGVCGAAETMLIDRAIAPPIWCRSSTRLARPAAPSVAMPRCARALPAATPATEQDWSTEYLDAIISVKVVDGVDEAIDHIETYSLAPHRGIVTEDEAVAARFLQRIDSAIVVHNASTQFADGGEFGFGGEIGIATGRMHARGPVGLEQLQTRA
jgi:glutamate-5-semialdehyde dehydrogenase